MLTQLNKNKLKNWIDTLEPSTQKTGRKSFIGVSRKKYKNLKDLKKQALYEDLELNVFIKQFRYIGKGKIKEMIEKYGEKNLAIDDSTIAHEDEIRLDETYYFYRMVIEV